MADFLTSIGDFLGLNKGKATQDAAGQNAALLSDLAKTGNANLNQAKDLTMGQLGQVQNGATMYQNALGLNGSSGNAAASSAFTTDPGYQFSQNQGIQALMRTAAARGDVGGGGLSTDLAGYVTNGANQQYGNWLSNLSNFQSQLPGATAQATGSLGDLTSFAGDIASGRTAANNQRAAGAEAGQGGLWDLANNVASVAGSAFGLKKPGVGAAATPGFGGYGSF
jgi:hypothetical protein